MMGYTFFMKILNLSNPFGAPVYHEETVSSTMDTARVLAGRNEAHGTVMCADFQEAGRGRLNRAWVTDRGENLIFTILLRYGEFSSIPRALTLRTGLALSLALEDFAPALSGAVKVKWPNDIMIGSRKAAGILAEGDGKNVYIGAGVNLAQREFPVEYRSKAVSVFQALPEGMAGFGHDARFVLLEKILLRLHKEIESPGEDWRERLLCRLYKKGEIVTFAEGAADSESLITGTLSGIGPGGELLIVPDDRTGERAFINGELRVY